MASIARICPTLKKGTVDTAITSGIPCLRADGTSYDYIYLSAWGADHGYVTGFFGSMSGPSGGFVAPPDPTFYSVTGWSSSDTSRALVTGFTTTIVGGSQNYLFIIPVTFLWFYPACTADPFAATQLFDIFAS